MIRYSLVAFRAVPLCSYQVDQEYPYEQAALNLIQQNTSVDGKKTYQFSGFQLHTIVDNGFIYVCAATADFGTITPYTFLSDLKKEFETSSLTSRAITAGHLELNREFEDSLVRLMEKHGKKNQGGQLGVLQNQVTEVTNVMRGNVDKVLERGERLEILVDNAEALNDSANTFNVTSTRLRRKMWCKNLKTNLCIAAIVVTVVFVLILIVLFSTGVLPPKPSEAGDSTTATKSPTAVPTVTTAINTNGR